MDAPEHPLRAYRFSFKPPLTLADLARRLRTTTPNLSRIENGKQKLEESLLIRAVEETGIPGERLRPDLARIFTPGLSAKSRRARPRRTRAAA